MLMQLLEKVEPFSGQNSGWTVSWVKYLRLCWGTYRPLEVGTFIPTPKDLPYVRNAIGGGVSTVSNGYSMTTTIHHSRVHSSCLGTS